MAFEVLVLGVGDAFSVRHLPTSFVLACDGHRLAIDCPDRYRAVLADACKRAGQAIEFAGIDDFLITHLHGDHVNGLEGAAFYRKFVEGRRIRLHTSAEVREVIWEQRLRASMGQLLEGDTVQSMAFEDYFDYRELRREEPNCIGPFRVWTRPTIHHVPTTALHIEAEGRTLGYSCDGVLDDGQLAFLSRADVILHETNLGPSHTPLAALVGLPEAIRSRVRLVHYPDHLDLSGSGIPALQEGDWLTI